MRALYLYFADPARPSPDGRPADSGPLVPIKPGAFVRWMAERERGKEAGNATGRRTIGGTIGGSALQRPPRLDPMG